MAESTTGYDYPTMMQQFYNPKSARGSRLGRGPAMASTMVQFGYGTPGTNVTVSPTFSNIGNPAVMTEGLSIGDVSLGDFGSSGDTFEPRPSMGPTPGPTGGTPGGSMTRSKEPVGTTLKTSAGIKEAIQKAAKKGQSKDPRVTRSEIKGILKESDKPRALRNAIEQGKVQIGGKAADFLNRQLKEAGARKLTSVQTKSDAPKKQKPKANKPVGVGGLFNKSGQPGTTNMKPTAQPKPKAKSQQKKEAPKAQAKQKAQAKSNKGKKKK